MDLNNYKMFDHFCFEKTDMIFAKSILGLNRKATNAAVRGELGRYPLVIHIFKQVIKNWLRIAKKDSHSIPFV